MLGGFSEHPILPSVVEAEIDSIRPPTQRVSKNGIKLQRAGYTEGLGDLRSDFAHRYYVTDQDDIDPKHKLQRRIPRLVAYPGVVLSPDGSIMEKHVQCAAALDYLLVEGTARSVGVGSFWHLHGKFTDGSTRDSVVLFANKRNARPRVTLWVACDDVKAYEVGALLRFQSKPVKVVSRHLQHYPVVFYTIKLANGIDFCTRHEFLWAPSSPSSSAPVPLRELHHVSALRHVDGSLQFQTSLGAVRKFFEGECLNQKIASMVASHMIVDRSYDLFGPQGIILAQAIWPVDCPVHSRQEFWSRDDSQASVSTSGSVEPKALMPKSGLFEMLKGGLRRSDAPTLVPKSKSLGYSDGEDSDLSEVDVLGAFDEKLRKFTKKHKRKPRPKATAKAKGRRILLSKLTKRSKTRKPVDVVRPEEVGEPKDVGVVADLEPAAKKMKLRDAKEVPWTRFNVGLPDANGRFNFLVYDEQGRSIGAHCRNHAGCKANKVLRKAPLGYVLLWLQLGDDKEMTLEEHRKLRKAILAGDYSDARTVARERGYSEDHLRELFLLEAIECIQDVVAEPAVVQK
jgi:hypothetical protein